MNEEAKSFAKQQEELIRKQLSDMYSNLTSSKDASITEAELRKQNLLNKIEQSRQPIEQRFGEDTRSAYVNKMLSQQNVGDLLNRMNLSNSGFGMGERIGVDTAYGKNLTSLMSDRSTALQGLENQKLNAIGEHNATLAGIDSTYAGAKLDMDKYISEKATQAYDKAYANYVNEQQAKWQRDFQQNQANISNSQAWARINLDRENSAAARLKAQKYTATPVPYTLGLKGVVSGNNVVYTMENGDTYTLPKGMNPWVGEYNSDVMTNGVYNPKKAFNGNNGGYQPNNYTVKANKWTTANGSAGKNYALTKTGAQAEINGQVQNIFKAGNSGEYVLWDGPKNDYIQLTTAQKKEAGLVK